MDMVFEVEASLAFLVQLSGRSIHKLTGEPFRGQRTLELGRAELYRR
jgi:hypothetical protein